METFSIQTVDDGTRSTVAPQGDIDLAAVDQLWDALDSRITAGRAVVFDCSGVEFLDSMGLRVLIKAAQKAGEVGATFHLTEPIAPVRRVLELSGVTDVFDVFGTSP